MFRCCRPGFLFRQSGKSAQRLCRGFNHKHIWISRLICLFWKLWAILHISLKIIVYIFDEFSVLNLEDFILSSSLINSCQHCRICNIKYRAWYQLKDNSEMFHLQDIFLYPLTSLGGKNRCSPHQKSFFVILLGCNHSFRLLKYVKISFCICAVEFYHFLK